MTSVTLLQWTSLRTEFWVMHWVKNYIISQALGSLNDTSRWCSIFSVLFLLKAGCVCMRVFMWVCACGPVGLKRKKSLTEVRNKRISALCRPSVPLWEKLSSSSGQRGESCSARLQPRADLTASLPGNYSGDWEAAPSPLALCTTERAHTHSQTTHTHIEGTRERVQK